MDPARDRRAGAGSLLGRRTAAQRLRGRRARHARRRRRRPGLFARLPRRLRPPRTLRPTRAGWVFFALVFGVGFAAMNTGNNLMYMVLSLLLAFLVLSGVLSESALRGIQVRRHLPREASAEAPAAVRLVIHNAQRRIASFAIVVEDLLGTRTETGRTAGRCFVMRVGPGETLTRAYSLTPERRGALEFAGFRVSTRFPFGLFSKAMRVPAPDALLVYPRLAPVALRPDSRRAPLGTHAPEGSGPADAETAGLRAYAPGDPPRHIHWRSALRRGELLVRDPERRAQADAHVHLRTRGAGEGADFEARVARAASEVSAHLEAGYRVSLATEGTRFAPGRGPGQRHRLLRFLARVEPETDSRPEAAGADSAAFGKPA